jgi:hypothetical protein
MKKKHFLSFGVGLINLCITITAIISSFYPPNTSNRVYYIVIYMILGVISCLVLLWLSKATANDDKYNVNNLAILQEQINKLSSKEDVLGLRDVIEQNIKNSPTFTSLKKQALDLSSEILTFVLDIPPMPERQLPYTDETWQLHTEAITNHGNNIRREFSRKFGPRLRYIFGEFVNNGLMEPRKNDVIYYTINEFGMTEAGELVGELAMKLPE